MAEPRGETEPPPLSPPPPPPPPLPPAAVHGGRSQSRNLSLDSRSLGRAPREPSWRTSLRLSLGIPGRRRGELRELLGLPVGLEREDEQPAAGAAAASAAGGPGGLCLEPREHAWMLAAAEGRFEALQELLEAEPGLLNRVDPLTGYSALHWLAKHGSHEGLIRMHDFARRHGLSLDVSAPGSGGLTPLHLAAQQGHDLVIKVLVGALGADSSRRDHSGHRAYHYLRPDVAPELRELAGAEESEETPRATSAPSGSLWRRGQTGNANNNCSIRRGSWIALLQERTDRGARGGDKASRVSQIQGFFRQLFYLFQDR
ncbi:ankyrin repeat domain-containing protein SOWAHD [Antechinus flavipes]|uniref:ankyrin repeat domain-containing protein SOWAHD n=1 Tax=Antechinus flavipes TaxID=38775 RepID=UPI0022367314|nr:ankyrin repeat domain-containing protein SOWAHD [Antechinus flavipes]